MLRAFVATALVATILAGGSLGQSGAVMEPRGSNPSGAITRTGAEAGKPILIYSASLEGEATKVPYYAGGVVTFLDRRTIEQHREGHQTWVGAPLEVATSGVLINLIPGDMQQEFRRSKEVEPGKLRVSPNGVVTRVVTDPAAREPLVRICIPGFAWYDILFQRKENILFVKSIVMTVLGCPDRSPEGYGKPPAAPCGATPL